MNVLQFSAWIYKWKECQVSDSFLHLGTVMGVSSGVGKLTAGLTEAVDSPAELSVQYVAVISCSRLLSSPKYFHYHFLKSHETWLNYFR